jgi:hypothetical protein
MKLGTLLLRDGVITLSQLEAALRAQVLYGGRLGTNLVELDFIDVDTLGGYLAAVLDVPLATKDMLDAADPGIIAWFGGERADRYNAFPLGLDRTHPEMMAVAFAEPREEKVLEELAQSLQRAIVPYIAPELRLYYYLEKHYGITRKARFVRAGSSRTAPTSVDDRRRSQPARGIEMPPAVRFEPRKKRPSQGPPVTPGSTVEGLYSWKEAIAAIDGAGHRDQIGQAFLDYAAGRLEVLALFILRDGNALGWRVHMAGRSTPPLEQVSLPLGGSSALQAACDSGQPYRGPSPSAGRPVEKRLWQDLGLAGEPAEMLVLPVMVKQRVINLVYAHAPGGGPVPPHIGDELWEMAQHAGDAYLRLIQAARQKTADPD